MRYMQQSGQSVLRELPKLGLCRALGEAWFRPAQLYLEDTKL